MVSDGVLGLQLHMCVGMILIDWIMIFGRGHWEEGERGRGGLGECGGLSVTLQHT